MNNYYGCGTTWPWTDFHQLNLGWILEKVKYCLEEVGQIDEKVQDAVNKALSDEKINEIVRTIMSGYMLNVKYPPEGVTPATGDGSADDTKAIQECIDYAAAKGGGAVFFPSGRYLTNSLTMKNGVTLFGFDQFGTTLALKEGATAPMIGGNGEKFGLCGLTIDAKAGVQTEEINAIAIVCVDAFLSGVTVTNGHNLLNYVGMGGKLILDCVTFGNAVEKCFTINGTVKVIADNVFCESVSSVAGQCVGEIASDDGIYSVYSVAETPVGFKCSGTGNHFILKVENAVEPYEDTGVDNSWDVYGISKEENYTGRYVRIAENILDSAEGECNRQADNITDTAQKTFVLQADEVFIDTKKPLKYGEIVNNGLKYVNYTDNQNNPYKMLVKDDFWDRTDKIYPSLFSGDDDYSKLQNAINYALENYYPTIILDRTFDITGHSLDVTKGLYISNEDFLRYRKKLTFMCVGSGELLKRDSGFMFTAKSYSGDFEFINCNFRGGVILNNTAQDEKAKINGCSVFDCSKMIRIFTNGCNYTLIGRVFDGSNSVDKVTNMQSCRSVGDTITYSDSFYKSGYLWDCVIDNCIIEQCNSAFYTADIPVDVAISKLTIINSCIEGTLRGIDISDRTKTVSLAGVVISNCYFEANGAININFNSRFIYGCTIEKNHFALNNETALKIKIRNNSNAYKNNEHSGIITTALDIESDFPTSYNKLLCYGNYVANGKLYDDSVSNLILDEFENGDFLQFASAKNLPINDADNVGKIGSGSISILENETFNNIPEKVGCLFWKQNGGFAVETFISTTQKYYIRFRTSGIGWSEWKEIFPKNQP